MINAFAAFEVRGELKPFSYDPGPLSAHEVEIDVQYCGVCHSDVSVIDNEWGFTQYPVVAGHEVVGTIAALGSEVGSLKLGQTVGLGGFEQRAFLSGGMVMRNDLLMCHVIHVHSPGTPTASPASMISRWRTTSIE